MKLKQADRRRKVAIKLKRTWKHFALREGWLNKGLAKVDANPKVFFL